MKKFICALTCVLLVIGLFRVILGVYAQTGNFIPTYNDLLNRFNVMPDLPQMFYEDFLKVKNTFDSMTEGFSNIDSLGAFFTAIGQFFAMIWNVVVCLADSILIPIKWLLWAMGTLFGFSA